MATTMQTRHGSTGPAPARHQTLPASPTLTNPDMILPEYDRSPSPVHLDSNGSQSPLTMWKNAQAMGASGIMTDMMYGHSLRHSHGYPSVAPMTPIIYGNGTMLSDIGEVTEVESTQGKKAPSLDQKHGPVRIPPHAPSNDIDIDSDSDSDSDIDSERDAALRSSPTMGNNGGSSLLGVKKRAREQATQRERRDSAGSESTITDQQDRANLFADFSDAVSVGGDSVFQGDDEESLASSYVDEVDVDSASTFGDTLPSSTSILPFVQRQRVSAAQLSRRAEQILANAKQRLTTMEDNLTRARTSLAVAPYSSSSSGSTPSPPIARATSALLWSISGPLSPPASCKSPGHGRKGSENSLRIGLPIKVYTQRPSSVQDVSRARQQLTMSKSADQSNGQYKRASYIVREAQISLEPLGEDDVSQVSHAGQVEPSHGRSKVTSPTFGTNPDRGLTRSVSVTQVREIKEQVKDLKGKISSLRDQALADSLKRKSLQGLRTPSPALYAPTNLWSGESDSGREAGSRDGMKSRNGAHSSCELANSDRDRALHGGDHRMGPSDAGDESIRDTYRNGYAGFPEYAASHPQPNPFDADADALREAGFVDVQDEDDMLTENGDAEEEEHAGLGDEYDSMSESGDSLYHEAVQHQVSHEDREDAFDYEHFFLHSAMGTISQRLPQHASDVSYASDDSIETTRGPLAEQSTSRGRYLSRQNSETSISTVQSFATANEGSSGRRSVGNGRMDEVLVDGLPRPHATAGGSLGMGPGSPPAAKRIAFATAASAPNGTCDPPSPEGQRRHETLYSATRRPMSSAATRRSHRPSVSSFESTGTTRSFPLVNKASKALGSSGIPTPDSGSPDQAMRSFTQSLLSSATDACQILQDPDTVKASVAHAGHKHSNSVNSTRSTTSPVGENGTLAVMESLSRDDRFLVERLVASLGRCVLGLTESGRASTESWMYRRRIDAARRMLDGLGQTSYDVV